MTGPYKAEELDKYAAGIGPDPPPAAFYFPIQCCILKQILVIFTMDITTRRSKVLALLIFFLSYLTLCVSAPTDSVI